MRSVHTAMARWRKVSSECSMWVPITLTVGIPKTLALELPEPTSALRSLRGTSGRTRQSRSQPSLRWKPVCPRAVMGRLPVDSETLGGGLANWPNLTWFACGA